MGTISYFLQDHGMCIREKDYWTVRQYLDTYENAAYTDLLDGYYLDFSFFDRRKFIGYFYPEDRHVLHWLADFIDFETCSEHYADFITEDYSEGQYRICYVQDREEKPYLAIQEQASVTFHNLKPVKK